MTPAERELLLKLAALVKATVPPVVTMIDGNTVTVMERISVVEELDRLTQQVIKHAPGS